MREIIKGDFVKCIYDDAFTTRGKYYEVLEDCSDTPSMMRASSMIYDAIIIRDNVGDRKRYELYKFELNIQKTRNDLIDYILE